MSDDEGIGNSWVITPSLDEIQVVMSEVGEGNTVISLYFRQAYVMDEDSGLKNAGAILATFGSSDSALMDIVSGEFKPTGKLPFALGNSREAIINQDSDAPGYKAGDTLYPRHKLLINNEFYYLLVAKMSGN
ncbi:hypothetical protein [Psychromonas hadalis]|uniref:hypothetical protein n=1 Tax=Psychromonas hadalis TaxID=211669 RepID=UPI0003B58049|nr:hypothetical protein [Psychromonas hadalis]